MQDLDAPDAKGFASNVTVEVYALGGTAPIGTTKGILAWEEFVEKYFTAKGYSSSIHLMSNFRIDFTDDDTAAVGCYAVVPYFILKVAGDKEAAEATVEVMNCRYTFNAKRQTDGCWKTTKLKIELQEIWRGIGFFPGGQGKGLG